MRHPTHWTETARLIFWTAVGAYGTTGLILLAEYLR